MTSYVERACPMPDCQESLYINLSSSRVIYDDDTAPDLADPAQAHTATWSIECSDGHVVLLPVDDGDHVIFNDLDLARLSALRSLGLVSP